MNFFDILLLIDAIIVVTLVALQEAKGGLGEAITGAGNSELFKNQKERGVELFLSRATLITVVLFIALAVARQFG